MEPSDVRIADFVNLTILQRIQDTFAKAMGVAAVTVDRNGKPVTETSNFCRVCLMIRSTPTGLTRCQKCDAEGGRRAHEMRRPYAYLCAGGFLDAAAPIIIDGEYVGSILCGQVIPADAQEDAIQNIIQRNTPLGLAHDDIEKAARGIVPLPRERFEAAVEMLAVTANCIIEMSAANLAQAQLMREAQERAALKAALQEAQLRAFKAQINPHFLFNSLTLLGYTAQAEDASRTEEIAYCLSDLLRYSLRNISTTVELGEEFRMIEQYLAIQKTGFGERLDSRVELDPALQQFEVPCMVLQPLVENAVIHGAEPLSSRVTVSVRAYTEGQHVVLEVADDGAGIPQEIVAAVNSGLQPGDKDSLGLQNVIQRLAGEYGEAFHVRVEGGPGQGAVIRLYIPGEAMQADSNHQMSHPLTAVTGNQMELDLLRRTAAERLMSEADLCEMWALNLDSYRLADINLEPIL
jgi:ligand-binding sensor protein/two-component sensor histidine kinase